MDVFPCGTDVKIRLLEKQGIITAISIRGSGLQYGVVYEVAGKIEEGWFSEPEIIPINTSNKGKIGFHLGGGK